MASSCDPFDLLPPDLRWLKVKTDLAIAVFELSQEYQMSITGYQPGLITAVIEQGKKNAQAKIDAALAKLAVAQRRAQVDLPAAIEGFAAKVDRETAAAIAEFATVDNGGPTLNDEIAAINTAAGTPLPPPAGLATIEPPPSK